MKCLKRATGVLTVLFVVVGFAAPIGAQVPFARPNGLIGAVLPRLTVRELVTTLSSTEILFHRDPDLNDEQRDTIEKFESRLRGVLFAIAAPIRAANAACVLRWPFDYAIVDNSLDRMLVERTREFRKLGLLLPGEQQQRFTANLNTLLSAELDVGERFALAAPAEYILAVPFACSGTTLFEPF